MKLQFPVNFIYISQPYKGSSHLGIDLGWASTGECGGSKQPVYAPADGVIEKIVSNYTTQDSTGSSYGNYILIKHDNGYKTRVAHLRHGTLKVKKGDKVTRGQRIATMGSTGRSDGPHVHYEVIKDGSTIDPLKVTYYTSDQIIASVTKKSYNLKKYPEDAKVEENASNEKQDAPMQEVNKFEQTFKQDCWVKIKVYKDETLIIK